MERAFRDVPHLVQGLDDALITPVRGAAVNPHVHHAGAQIDRAVRPR
ncbi:hypothetical protein [Streptomyces sp. NPDC058653]